MDNLLIRATIQKRWDLVKLILKEFNVSEDAKKYAQSIAIEYLRREI